MGSIKKITVCNMCGNTNLEIVIDPGEKYLTSFFSKANMFSSLTRLPLQEKNQFIISYS